MATIAMNFDTHAFVKQLTAAGMPEKQAEVLAEYQVHLLEDSAVTKQDLKALALEIDVKLAKLRAEVITDLVKWMLGVAVAQSAFIISAFKLFH